MCSPKGDYAAQLELMPRILETSQLVIDPKDFVVGDIGLPLNLDRPFDLVLLLETAEHIDGKFAPTIVENATRHSDLVLFSAAVPGQGGLHHVNEQLPEYRAKLFDSCDFDVFDVIRSIIWNDKSIPSWYRQNMLVFCRRSSSAHHRLTDLGFKPSSPPLGRVHPSLLQWYASQVSAKASALRQHAERITAMESDLSAMSSKLAERDASIKQLSTELSVAAARSAEQEAAIKKLSGELSTAAARLAEQEATIKRLGGQISTSAAKVAEQEETIERLSNELSAAGRLVERQAEIDTEMSALRQQMRRIGGSWGSLIRERVKSDTAVSIWQRAALMLPLQLLAPILKPARKRLRRIETAHALKREYLAVKHSGLFDSEYYLSAYPDLRGRIDDPVIHYVRHGAKEMRNPSQFFDTACYLRDNPDVAAAGVNPVAHFASTGLAEGRSSIRAASISPAPSEPAAVNGELKNPLERIIGFQLADGLLTWGPEHVIEIQKSFSDPSYAMRFLGEREHCDAELSLPAGSQIAVYTSTRGNYFFNEIRDLIVQGLREADYEPIILNEKAAEPCDTAISVVIAPHEFFTLGAGDRWLTDSFLSNSVIVNTEQWQTHWFAKSLPALLKARRIFDINLQSAAGLRSLNLPASFLPLGYVPDFGPFSFHQRLPDVLALKGISPRVRNYMRGPGEGLADRPLDVTFIGANTPRREAFFSSHAATFAKYHSFLYLPRSDVPFVSGPEAAMTTEAAAGIEQRSKIVLNIHRDDHRYFEWHRIVLHGIGHQSVVLTERSQKVPGFSPGRHYFEADLAEIPEMMEWLLNTNDGQMAANCPPERIRSALGQVPAY